MIEAKFSVLHFSPSVWQTLLLDERIEPLATVCENDLKLGA